MPMHTMIVPSRGPAMYQVTISGKKLAKKVASKLIESSVYYSVTPLPNNEYEYCVKQDVAHVLSNIISTL